MSTKNNLGAAKQSRTRKFAKRLGGAIAGMTGLTVTDNAGPEMVHNPAVKEPTKEDIDLIKNLVGTSIRTHKKIPENKIVFFTKKFCTPKECLEFVNAAGAINPDEHNEKELSSETTVPRAKRIHFNMNIDTKDGHMHVPLSRDWFVQTETVNKLHAKQQQRKYANFVSGFENHPVVKKIYDRHHEVFDIPANTVTLSIMQTSFYNSTNTSKDPTGQGIHTDGVENVSIMVLEKENLKGPTNHFYLPREGDAAKLERPLTEAELQIGDMVHFHDNKCYHKVGTNIKLMDITKGGKRTALIIGGPCESQLCGEDHLANQLVANPMFSVRSPHYQAAHVIAFDDEQHGH